MKYDIKSTLLYALGMTINNEDDPKVKEEMEDLEEKITTGEIKFE